MTTTTLHQGTELDRLVTLLKDAQSGWYLSDLQKLEPNLTRKALEVYWVLETEWAQDASWYKIDDILKELGARVDEIRTNGSVKNT